MTTSLHMRVDVAQVPLMLGQTGAGPAGTSSVTALPLVAVVLVLVLVLVLRGSPGLPGGGSWVPFSPFRWLRRRVRGLLIGCVLLTALFAILPAALATVQERAVTDAASQTARDDVSCESKARAASFGLSALASANRTRYNVRNGKNIAAYAACIDGVFEVRWTRSGKASPGDAVALPDHVIFHTFPLENEDNTRELDAERKLLEDIAARYGPQSAGVVYLFSERPFCESCGGVIDQFRVQRPLIVLHAMDTHPRPG